MSILFQSLQPLEQSIPKSFSVTWTQSVEKRVNSLMILGAQILIHLIEGVAHNLFGRVICCQNQHGLGVINMQIRNDTSNHLKCVLPLVLPL